MLVKNIIKGLLSLLVLLWPFIIYFAISYGAFSYVIIAMILTFTLRILLIDGKFKLLKYTSVLTSVLAILLAILAYILGSFDLLLYYPVVISVCLFLIFSLSLVIKKPIITEFAKLIEKNLDSFAYKYTKVVTYIWILFFLINGCISLYTIKSQNLELWTLYNGFISYLLIALLLLVEYLIRRILRWHLSK